MLLRSSTWRRLVVLLAAAAMVWLREPAVLLEPRFYAEEGAVYFRYAWSHGFFDAVLAPHQGYYSLVPNVATALAARLVPLELAPRLTGLVALAVNLLPVAWILWSHAPIWRSLATRCVGAAILVLVDVDQGFVFDTIFSQYHLTVLAAVLLIDDSSVDFAGTRRLVRDLLLVLCGLGSPGACFLFPAFLYVAWTRRRTSSWVAFAILSGACAVQALVALAGKSGGTGYLAGRAALLDPAALPPAMLMNAVDPLFSWAAVSSVRGAVYGWFAAGGARHVVVITASLIAIASLLYFTSHGIERRARVAFVLAFVCTSALTLVFATGSVELHLRFGSNKRYLYASSVILLLLLLAGSSHGARRGVRISCRVLLASALVGCLADFWTNTRDDSDWSVWPEEVAKFEADAGYLLKIWPKGHVVKLSQQRGPPNLTLTSRVVGRAFSAGGSTLPSLRVYQRDVGRIVVAEVRSSRPRALGTLVVGPPPESPIRLRLTPEVEATVLVSIWGWSPMRSEFETDDNGIWRLTVGIEDLADLAGSTCNVQAVLTTPVLEVTNAVEITVRSR